jgi:hypothetical protein
MKSINSYITRRSKVLVLHWYISPFHYLPSPFSPPRKPTNTFHQRSHITSTPLHSQSTRIRDVVEKLLDIFCTDPLALAVPTDQRLLTTPGQEMNAWLPGSTHSQSNAFDLPSGKRVTLKMPMAATGSPVRRRKGKEKMGDEEAVER